MELIKSE